MSRNVRIEVGQRFHLVGSPPARIGSWKVAAVFKSTVDGVEYARLAQVNDPTRQKTIAVSALLDGRQYARSAISAGPEIAGGAG
jgi:hypothetical protein